MGIEYPGDPPGTGFDSDFGVPTEPEGTPLSEAGTSDRNHPELHDAINKAVMALETWAALRTHDHSGDDTSVGHGKKLAQANTHESSDTDTGVVSKHHTLGTSAYQAAAGNHIHDYAGPTIINKPYIVCTSHTRPTTPFLGMMIYEVDTNTVRVWARFPTNPQATGVISFDNFNRTADYDLDVLFWELHYKHPPGNGFWNIWHWPTGFFWPAYAPYFFSVWWTELLTEHNWVLARRVHPDDHQSDTDDQEITCSWGDHEFEVDLDFDGDDSHDPGIHHYFRLSDDWQEYVVAQIHKHYIIVKYTFSGPDGEIALGQVKIPDWEPRLVWRIQALDWGFYFYRNEILVATIVDNDHRHHKDASHRGWGVGCHVVGHPGGQWRPPDIVGCGIRDNTSYSAVARWGLLPVASIPILIAEAHVTQQVFPRIKKVVMFDHVILDWHGPHGFMEASTTDILISEPGVYHVHASVCWDPQRTFHDQSMVGIEANGQDISRKVWTFIRGYTWVPGFSQTNEINFWYRFNAGDVVRVVTRHNGTVASWLWYDFNDPDSQLCHVELVYHSP